MEDCCHGWNYQWTTHLELDAVFLPAVGLELGVDELHEHVPLHQHVREGGAREDPHHLRAQPGQPAQLTLQRQFAIFSHVHCSQSDLRCQRNFAEHNMQYVECAYDHLMHSHIRIF